MTKFSFKQLAATALLMCCSVTAVANDFEVNGIFYNITNLINNTVEVTFKGESMTEYSNEYTYYVEIPDSVVYEGTTFRVTSIAKCAFYKCSSLKSITIPNSVTLIGEEAFYGCTGLTSATIGNSVTNIGKSAFYNCHNLTGIEIPGSVTKIGERVFDSCKGLKSIEIPNSVKEIGEYAFYNCINLGRITLPDSIATIKTGTFYSCGRLDSITIPAGVTSVENNAFAKCKGLTEISIPDNVVILEGNAFTECTELTTATIGKGVKYFNKNLIGTGNPFRKCPNLVNITVSEDNPTYDSRDNCNAIIEKRNNRIMVGCKNSTIHESVTSIYLSAFANCTGLTQIEIPNNVKHIFASAFEGCTNLVTIKFSENVTGIERYAFRECNALTEIYLMSENPPTIYSDTFSKYSATLFVPQGTKAAYESANYWKNFTNIKEISYTGIEDTNEEVNNKMNNVYDLSGRTVVENPTSGIYIVDGKKIFIK